MISASAIEAYIACALGIQAAKTFMIGFECAIPPETQVLTNYNPITKERFVPKHKLASEMLPFPADLISASGIYLNNKLDDWFYKYHIEQRGKSK